MKKKNEPFGISQSICTRTLRNLTRYLHTNPPEPHQASSPPKPSETSQSLCTGTFQNLTRTLRNLTTHLLLDPPEPHQVAAPETSGTSSGTFTKTLCGASAGIFTGTLRNFTRYLHQNPPEPGVEAPPDRAPELIWAKDPIAKFCCWGKIRPHRFGGEGVLIGGQQQH